MLETWKKKKLKELAIINYGKSPKEIIAEDGNVPVVGTGGVERFGKDYLYDGESVILGRKGTIDKPNYINGKFWVIDTAYFLSGFNDANVKWLYYFLTTVDLRSMNEATGVPSLSRDFLYKLEIPTPPKDEQRQIAAILLCIDRVIELTEALIAKQQRLKVGLMQKLLTKGIDEHGKLRSEATHEFKDSPLDRIPTEWSVDTCESICREITVGIVIKPTQYYAPEGVPALRSANIEENGVNTRDLVFISEDSNKMLSKSRLRSGDLVTVRTGYPGTTAVVPDYLVGANCIDLLITRPGPRIVSEYLARWINSGFGKRQIFRGQGGLAQQHFNVREFQRLLVPVPSLNEQEAIVRVLKTQDLLISVEEKRKQNLLAIKTGLMQSLLTGKVRVTSLLETQSRTDG